MIVRLEIQGIDVYSNCLFLKSQYSSMKKTAKNIVFFIKFYPQCEGMPAKLVKSMLSRMLKHCFSACRHKKYSSFLQFISIIMDISLVF
jgi:hypothetical protein